MQVMTPPLKSLNTRVKSLEQELQALKDQVQMQQATSQAAGSSTEAGSGVEGGSMHPAATQPQKSQLQHEPVHNVQDSIGVAASSETVRAAGPGGHPTTAGCMPDGCTGSSETNLKQYGGRMHLASWRAPHMNRSPLNVKADQMHPGFDADAGSPDSCGERHSKALLSQLTASYPFHDGSSGRSTRKGLAPINPLRVPYSASHRVATAAQTATGLKAMDGPTSRKDALRSLLHPLSSHRMSPVGAPPQHTPTGSGWKTGEDDAVTDAAQLTVSLSTDPSASMTGLRGMLVGASLLVNLLVAQACV